MGPDNKKHADVQTYAEDMAGVLEDDTGGLIKKIIHEEEEHQKEKKDASPESKKNKFFMIVGTVLVLTAFAILFYFFTERNAKTVDVQAQFTPLIFHDQSDFIEVSELDKDKIANVVRSAILGTTVKAGGVEGFYLTENKNVIGFKRFIDLIKGNFVQGVTSSGVGRVVDDHFLMGVVHNDSNDFFILLKVSSLVDVFDSMRAWENKMFFDLHGFFGVPISGATNNLLTKDFESGVVENKNARILYEENETDGKKIALMYVILDDNFIIITDTARTTREVILRLASSQIKK